MISPLPNLLIVDDNPINLEYLRIVLRDLDAKLITAESGNIALEKTKDTELALAILDIQMPGMNGYELAIRINEERGSNKVPIIFITANHFNEMDVFQGYGCGAVDYIFKPIKNPILISKVNVFLDLFNQKQIIIHEAILLEKNAEELIRVNAALKKSEEKYRSYIDNAPDGVFIANESGKFLEVNDAACKLTGYSKEELLNLSFTNLLTERSIKKGIEQFRKLEPNDTVKIELPFRVKNRSTCWWAIAAVKLSETRFLGFAKDITQSRYAEDQLKESESSLEEAQRIAQTGSWKWDMTLNTVKWSKEMFRVYDMDPGTYDGNPEALLKILHPEDVNKFTNSMNRNLAVGDLPTLEYRVIHNNGTIHNIFAEGRVESDATGKPFKSIGTAKDITEQKRAENFSNELLQLSIQLTGIPNTKIATALQLSLSRIGSFLAADRAYIYELNKNNTISNTHEWCNKGIHPMIRKLQCVPCEAFSNWVDALHRNENIIIPSVHDLPDKWKSEREILIKRGIQSLITIPILNENNLIGFVGLHSTLEKKDYDISLINRLKVWSNMLAGLIKSQRIEESLDQTRQNYETFFNSINDFLIVLDLQANIIYANYTTIGRLGYSSRELLGNQVSMLHPEEHRDEIRIIISKILSGEVNFNPFPFISKSGECISVETRTSHGLWNGQPAIFGVSKDISLIKISEEKFSKIFYLNPSSCDLIDTTTGKYVEVNEAFCSLSGFDKDQVIGKSAVELGILTQNDLDALKLKIGSAEKIHNLETNLKTKNGEIKDVLISIDYMLVQNKKYRFTVVQDVTGLKIAEHTLKISEEKYRTMLNASPDGILLINLKGIITEVSEIGLELFDADNRNDLVGKDFYQFIPANETNALKDILEKTVSEGLVQNVELKIRKKSQNTFQSEISSTLIQAPDGEPMSFMITIRDISQRKKIETKQIHADRMANLGEMASGIAHEINQPLNIISMVMDKILFEADKTETINIEFLKTKSDKIFDNITRIHNIIDHVRAFSRSDNNYLLTAFDINSSIENAVSMITEQYKHLDINLNTQLCRQIPQIVGNTFKFEQVIVNLLTNAKDAVLEKRSKQGDYCDLKVVIKTYLENKSLIVEIKDNGTGIDKEDIHNIMLPFYTTKEEGKGTGLGLSICYQIIKEMNGTIDISSDGINGTKIKLVINLQKPN